MKIFLLVFILFTCGLKVFGQVNTDGKQLIKQYEQLIKDGKILEADKLILNLEKVLFFESFQQEKLSHFLLN